VAKRHRDDIDDVGLVIDDKHPELLQLADHRRRISNSNLSNS
jgi:hypothetical protein